MPSPCISDTIGYMPMSCYGWNGLGQMHIPWNCVLHTTLKCHELLTMSYVVTYAIMLTQYTTPVCCFAQGPQFIFQHYIVSVFVKSLIFGNVAIWSTCICITMICFNVIRNKWHIHQMFFSWFSLIHHNALNATLQIYQQRPRYVIYL